MRYRTSPDIDTICVLHNIGGLVQADMRYESNFCGWRTIEFLSSLLSQREEALSDVCAFIFLEMRC